MTKGMRLALLGGAVVIVAGSAAAYALWPKGSGVTPGMGAYAREFDLCRRSLFEIELRIGAKVEYIPRTEYHQVKGEHLLMGGQANVTRSADFPTVRNVYECEVYQDAMVKSKVAPVNSNNGRLPG
jgi:hypothetical protein